MNLNLRKASRIVFGLWIVAMLVVWVIFHNEQQCVDAQRFVRNAFNNWDNGTLYPSRIDLYADYITAIGYTNYIQLVHLCLGKIGWIQFINIAMNIAIACEMYYVARSFFGITTAYVALILFCLTTTNLFPPLQLVTEIPYLFLALSSFTVCVYVAKGLSGRKMHPAKSCALLVLSGVIFAIAHTVRAVELAFVVPALVLLAWSVFLSDGTTATRQRLVAKATARVASVLLPYVIVLVGIGFFYKAQTGIYLNGPMTGWHNFIKVADTDNPVSTGDSPVYEPGGYAYIPSWDKYTFAERDSMYKEMGLRWLRSHPSQFLWAYVRRCVKLWGADYYYLPGLTSSISFQYAIHQPGAEKALLKMRLKEVCYSAVWYFILLLFIVGLIRTLRMAINTRHSAPQPAGASPFQQWNFVGGTVLLFVMCLGTAGTCLFPIEIRFHYPYNWALTILGAQSLVGILTRKGIIRDS